MKSSDGEKYQLRPRALRGRQEARARRQPAPLSKYRRKTANARERSRMREINRAFEALRRAVPAGAAAAAVPGLPAPCEKLTKITTLRLAMRYIAALTAALRAPGAGGGPPGPREPSPEPECWPSPLCSDLSEFSSELGQDGEDFAEDSLTPFESFLAEFNYIERTFV